MKSSVAVGGLRGVRGVIRRGSSLGGVFKVLALSMALTLVWGSAALADTVTNLLDNSPAPTQFEEVRLNEGETRNVPLRVIATGEDGDSGCNIDASPEALQLGFNSTNDNIAREDPNGSTVTFQDGADAGSDGCGPNSSGGLNPPAAAPDDRSISVRGVSRGTADISVAQPPVRNTTGKGTYTYGAVTFTAIVQNVAPTANGNSYNTNEDNALTVNAPGVLGNDTDPGNNPLTAVLVTPPQNGTLRFNADGSFVYTPNANFNGADTFTYRASDGQAESNLATVSINVAPVNDKPDAAPDTLATEEDLPAAVNVLDNDTDADGDLLTVTSNTQPANGTVTCAPNGSCTYTPDADFNGSDSFTYTVSDGKGGTSTATIKIEVRPVNDPPRAQNDAYAAAEDEPLRVAAPGVLENDTDPENNRLRALLQTGPANGTLTLEPDGSFVYTPNPNFSGQDFFTYRANDDIDSSNVATVTINVAETNDPATAQNDTATTNEDNPVTVNVQANDSSGPVGEVGQTLTTESVTAQPQNGTARINPDGTITYTPNANFSGEDSFTYRVCDDGAPRECAEATVRVAVSPVNDSPTAENDRQAVVEDGTLNIPASELTANDTAGPGEDGQALTVTQVGNPQNGTVKLENGRVIFQPDPDYSGPASFEYTVCDDGDPQECDTATVSVEVGAANDAPVVRDDRGSTGAAAVVANSYISQYASQNAASPTRLYRPDTSSRPYTFGKIGNDIVRPMNAIGYRSTDNMLYGYRMIKSPGIVKVDPSTGATRFLGNPRGLPAATNYFTGDVSPDGSTYYLYGHKSGILRVVDLSAFRAKSVKLSSAISVADLAVSPVNGRLYGVDGNGRLLEVDPGTGKVTTKSVPSLKPGGYGAAWFTVDGDLIAYENGRASTRTAGTLYQIQNPTTEPVVVSSEAGPYTAGNDGASFVAPANPAGLSVEVDVLANDADPDGALDPTTLRVIEPPAHGTVRVNADGSLTYTTDATYGGTDSFRYEVCDKDPAPQCAAATVSITAAPVPDAAVEPPVTAPVDGLSALKE